MTRSPWAIFQENQQANASEKIADFALKAFNNPLPDEVLKITKQAIIDQYGLQIGGTEFSWSQAIYQHTIQHTQTIGNSSITRYGELVSPLQAAFINSCFAHAQDFDDSHQEAQTHPGSVVIPAAIAIGEHLNLSGECVLQAITIGMEIMLRLAHSLCPACIEGGHHTPPTVGPFGAAIACGLLLGLDKKQLVNALGICGSYAGGLVEYTVSGGSVKRLHTGLGARAGVEAALLAKKGITGPSTVIDGPKGLWITFGRGKAYPERLFDQIGEKYLLSTIMFKPYNCCYLIHPAIQCFLEMCKTNQLNSDNIASVRVGMSQFSVSHAGKIKIPKDELGAQFSTSFTLALSLIRAEPAMWSYTEEVLNNNEIIELAKKIDVYVDSEANTEFPQKNGVIVEIITKDESKFSSRIKDPKGSPANLLTPADVKQKFLNNISRTLDEEIAHHLYNKLARFEKLKKIDEIRLIFPIQQTAKYTCKL